MNSVNTLFVISTIFVPLLLISLNYESISDYYTYSVPLNSMKLWDAGWYSSSDQFSEIMKVKGSKCFTTLSMNDFCYPPPRKSGAVGTSSLHGNEPGFDGGEMHFDNVNPGTLYFTMKNMTQIDENSVLLTFGDKDGVVTGRISVSTGSFEFSTIIEKFDTFITNCNDIEGTSVTIVQYLGLETIDGVDYFVTWHTGADLENPITCDYPQIIQHSLNHKFGI